MEDEDHAPPLTGSPAEHWHSRLRREQALPLLPFPHLSTGWDNHRWIQFRTATAGLDAWLAGFHHGYTFAGSDGTPYQLFAGAQASAPLPSYRVKGNQRTTINLRTEALLTLATNWLTAPRGAFTSGSPSPRPVLRQVPGQILAEAIDPITAALGAPDIPQPNPLAAGATPEAQQT
jgi:hypothetical protein